MSRTLFAAREGRLCLWLGGPALAFWIFVRITRELIEGEVGTMDSAILLCCSQEAHALAYDRSCGCDRAGIDHPGRIVLRLHSRGVAGVARPPVLFIAPDLLALPANENAEVFNIAQSCPRLVAYKGNQRVESIMKSRLRRNTCSDCIGI